MMRTACIVRSWTKDDGNYIRSSYLQNVHRGHPLKYVPNTLYFEPQGQLLEFLLQASQVLVACFPDAPDEILGWLIYQHQSNSVLVAHYIYVRTSARGSGVGLALIEAAAGPRKLIVATHASDEFCRLRHKAAPRRVVYDPYLLTRLQRMAA